MFVPVLIITKQVSDVVTAILIDPKKAYEEDIWYYG